jgi:hypothetical protein
MFESSCFVEKNQLVDDDTSTLCSNEENIDLEALNLICAEISEGLGDGGCDPKCLQTPISLKKGACKGIRPRQKKKTEVILNERHFLEL